MGHVAEEVKSNSASVDSTHPLITQYCRKLLVTSVCLRQDRSGSVARKITPVGTQNGFEEM